MYGITSKGGQVTHLVEGQMAGHSPWRDALPTLCGRSLVASNYYEIDDCRERTLCSGCEGPAKARAMTSPVVIRETYIAP